MEQRRYIPCPKCYSKLPLSAIQQPNTYCPICLCTHCMICRQPTQLFLGVLNQCACIERRRRLYRIIRPPINILLTLILIALLPMVSFSMLVIVTQEGLQQFRNPKRTLLFIAFIPFLLIVAACTIPQTLCRIIRTFIRVTTRGEWMKFPSI